MASTLDLRRKIKSIRGTQKLTQAMQMVSAAKMNRAIAATLASRTYSRLIWQLIRHLVPRVHADDHALLTVRPITRVAVVVLTANRGLAGALNSSLLRKVTAVIRQRLAAEQRVSIISLGRKGTQFLARFFAKELAADFPSPDTVAGFSDTTALSSAAIDQFLAGTYDEVIVAYNEFRSVLKQEPLIRTLLPIIPDVSRPEANRSHPTGEVLSHPSGIGVGTDLTFEPSKDRVLDVLLPRALRTQLYQMLLDANASEHAARMVAMKNATENAGDIIADLTLTMNSLRQAGITQEISEISAGAEALRSR